MKGVRSVKAVFLGILASQGFIRLADRTYGKGASGAVAECGQGAILTETYFGPGSLRPDGAGLLH